MDEINRVARVMVDAEPSADLEARIRARLDEVPPARARNNWGAWQITAGLAAAATIALLVWVPRPGSRVQGPGSRVPGPESGSLPVAASDISPNRPLPSVISPLVTLPPLRHSTGGSRAQVQVTPALSAEELAWMDRRIPALDPVVALEMDQLAMESIQPEPLAIPPLIMTALPTDGGTTERRER
jgi:hypothetical protein